MYRLLEIGEEIKDSDECHDYIRHSWSATQITECYVTRNSPVYRRLITDTKQPDHLDLTEYKIDIATELVGLQTQIDELKLEVKYSKTNGDLSNELYELKTRQGHTAFEKRDIKEERELAKKYMERELPKDHPYKPTPPKDFQFGEKEINGIPHFEGEMKVPTKTEMPKPGSISPISISESRETTKTFPFKDGMLVREIGTNKYHEYRVRYASDDDRNYELIPRMRYQWSGSVPPIGHDNWIAYFHDNDSDKITADYSGMRYEDKEWTNKSDDPFHSFEILSEDK